MQLVTTKTIQVPSLSSSIANVERRKTKHEATEEGAEAGAAADAESIASEFDLSI